MIIWLVSISTGITCLVAAACIFAKWMARIESKLDALYKDNSLFMQYCLSLQSKAEEARKNEAAPDN